MASDDPFDCFGSDDGSTSDRSENDLQESAGDTAKRDESCGVLSFHPNTEQSLLMHVKNSICPEDLLPCQHVLKEVDWFCSSRHWMMMVGPEKGAIIREILQKSMEKKVDSGKFIAVELGTYCGYGSIFISSMLKLDKERYRDIEFSLFSVEINPEYSAVAKEMIEIAKVDDLVTVLENDLLMDGSTGNVGDLVKSAIMEKYDESVLENGIDFLVIDHDKDAYLSDLLRLEASGLIRCGTIVAADNVLFAGIHEYIDYMKGLDKQGIVKTMTKEASVEYCYPDIKEDKDIFKDGVEISEYLKNPKN